MIPLKDHNPSGRTPFINYILIVVNVLVFLYMFTLSSAGLEQFINQYAAIPALVTQGDNLFSLFSSMFLHGGLAHIIGNMLFLNIFGDNLEDTLGHFYYLLFYLFCGLVASGLQIVVNPSSLVPSLGASGAIAGVMGGYLVLFPRHKIDILFSFGFLLRTATVPAYFMLFYWFVFQLFAGVGSLAYIDQSMGGVAYFAHIGGFAAGYLLISILKNRLRPDYYSA
jgi:membrane associated rhomboid family serine protease